MDNPTDVSHEEYKANKEFEKFLWGHSVWIRRALLATAVLAVYAALTNWTIRVLFADVGRFWFFAMFFAALAFVYHCTLYMLLFKEIMGGTVNKFFRTLVYIAVPSSFYPLVPMVIEPGLLIFIFPLALMALIALFFFFMLVVFAFVRGCIKYTNKEDAEWRHIDYKKEEAKRWLFIGFFAPVLGSAIYLILHRDQKSN